MKLLLAGLLVARLSFAWTLISNGVLGWVNGKITIHVNTTNCTISSSALYAVIDQAIETWNSVPTAGLKIVRDPNASSVSVVDFLAGSASQSPSILCDPSFGTDNNTSADLVPAATRMNPPSGHLNYGGMLLNAQDNAQASIDKLTSAQLAITITHEMGHMLGLGHSSQKEALMYYSISNKTAAVLTEDDAEGITYLYPRNEFTGGPMGCGAVHSPNSSPQPFLWFIGLLAAMNVLVMIVFRRIAQVAKSGQ